MKFTCMKTCFPGRLYEAGKDYDIKPNENFPFKHFSGADEEARSYLKSLQPAEPKREIIEEPPKEAIPPPAFTGDADNVSEEKAAPETKKKK